MGLGFRVTLNEDGKDHKEHGLIGYDCDSETHFVVGLLSGFYKAFIGLLYCFYMAFIGLL